MKNNILKIIIISSLLIPSFSQAISVYTNEATSVLESTATLNGGANLFMDGCTQNTMYSATTGELCNSSYTLPEVTGYFRYSKSAIAPIFCNDIYGSNMISTSDKKLGTNRTAVTFSEGINGLTPDTKYYYCAIVSNKDSIIYGGESIVKSFTTKPLKTTVKTKDATRITSTSATLNGSYNAVKSVSTYFKYREEDKKSSDKTSIVWKDWKEVGKQNHEKGNYSSLNGNIKYSLTGLKPSTKYSFMVETSDTEAIHIPTYPLSFTTLAETGTVIGNNTGTCYDRIQNGDETGVDTGGRCSNYTTGGNGNCYDEIQNGNETGVDTGGRCNFYINNTGTCYDRIQNGDETGVDTGGRCSVYVNDFTTCYDRIQNGDETGVDTGGRCGSTSGDGDDDSGTWTGEDGGSGTWIVTIGTGGSGTAIWTGIGDGTGTWTSSTGSGTWSNGTGSGGAGTGTWVFGNGPGTWRSNANSGIINTNPLVLGQHIAPPSLAIVRYHEGIETVFARQIVADLVFARLYGYVDGTDLQTFAWDLAHLFAKMFGYVDKNGREIRVSQPDIAAYQLQLIGDKLTVYEYYNSVIVDLRNVTTDFKNASNYEYYWKK